MKNTKSNKEIAEAFSLGLFNGIRIMGYTPVGYWLQKPHTQPAWDTRPAPVHPDGLVWPADFIDTTWSSDERAKLVQYLKAGQTYIGYMGYSPCRLCDLEFNGTTDLHDPVGMFYWPEGYAHYVEFHDVKPPQDLIDYVLNKDNTND